MSIAWVQNILSHLLFQEPNSSEGIGVGLTYAENVVWFEAQCTNENFSNVIRNSKMSAEELKESGIMTEDVMDITASARANVDYINNLYQENCDMYSQKRRRCFKSHSPLGILEPLLTSKGKIIHIARNPKDVSVSLWHHSRSKDFGYSGDFNHFLEKMFSCGQIESGNWWEYVVPFWLASQRTKFCEENEELKSIWYTNVLTLWYEDIMQFPEENILKIANFLDVKDITSQRIEEIAASCSFDSMKSLQSSGGVVLKERKIMGTTECGSIEAPSANQIRKGGSGGWKKYFSDEQSSTFDELHAKEVERCFHLFEDYGMREGGVNCSVLGASFNQEIHWG